MNIVLLGPPVSGKRTLADSLYVKYGMPSVSPRALFRAGKAMCTSLGAQADALTSKGYLVSDALVNFVVATWLQKNSLNDGVVFDGYPRTVGQGDNLLQILERCGHLLDATILLEARVELLRERVKARAACCACGLIVSIGVHVATDEMLCPQCAERLNRRADDTVEALVSRIREYEDKMPPLIDYYERRNLLQRVNSERPPEQVFTEVCQILYA